MDNTTTDPLGLLLTWALGMQYVGAVAAGIILAVSIIKFPVVMAALAAAVVVPYTIGRAAVRWGEADG